MAYDKKKNDLGWIGLVAYAVLKVPDPIFWPVGCPWKVPWVSDHAQVAPGYS